MPTGKPTKPAVQPSSQFTTVRPSDSGGLQAMPFIIIATLDQLVIAFKWQIHIGRVSLFIDRVLENDPSNSRKSQCLLTTTVIVSVIDVNGCVILPLDPREFVSFLSSSRRGG